MCETFRPLLTDVNFHEILCLVFIIFSDGPISETFPAKRIPITSRPKSIKPVSKNNNKNVSNKNRMATVQESDIQSKFTSKFLSSSIASTNIMDTSDLPVTMETTTTTTLGTYQQHYV